MGFMQDFMELCREFAPFATVIASLATVAIIPVLSKLNKIENKIDVMTESFKGHEKLDEARFKAHEQRLNEVFRHSEGL